MRFKPLSCTTVKIKHLLPVKQKMTEGLSPETLLLRRLVFLHSSPPPRDLACVQSSDRALRRHDCPVEVTDVQIRWLGFTFPFQACFGKLTLTCRHKSKECLKVVLCVSGEQIYVWSRFVFLRVDLSTSSSCKWTWIDPFLRRLTVRRSRRSTSSQEWTG